MTQRQSSLGGMGSHAGAWKREKLGSMISLIGGGTPSKDKEEYWGNEIPWATVKDLKKDRLITTQDSITQLGLDKSASKIVKSGAIIIATRMAVGRVVITGMDVAINQDLKGITCTDKIDTKYLYYYLSSQENYFNRVSSGATVKGIKINHITDVKIPLPPLAEQQKIAAILDAADQLRQKDQQLIDHYTALSQSLFLEMFGDPVTNPMGWKYETLNKLCIKITDGTHHSPKLVKSGVPYVTAKHVKLHGLDFLRKPTYVKQNSHDEIYARCAPEYGDVLYIKDGATTGVACINTFREPISLLSSLALLKTKSEVIDNHYLCFWLNHNGIKERLIQQYMSGAAIQRYTLAKINTFSVMVPSIDLQQKFAKYMASLEQQKQQAQASLEKSEALFNSLLQRAFKGELTQNSPA